MSTKQTLNAVTVGASGPTSISNPDGSSIDFTELPGNFNAVTMILRVKPSGAQRFKDYDPINPPTTTVPLP